MGFNSGFKGLNNRIRTFVNLRIVGIGGQSLAGRPGRFYPNVKGVSYIH